MSKLFSIFQSLLPNDTKREIQDMKTFYLELLQKNNLPQKETKENRLVQVWLDCSSFSYYEKKKDFKLALTYSEACNVAKLLNDNVFAKENLLLKYYEGFPGGEMTFIVERFDKDWVTGPISCTRKKMEMDHHFYLMTNEQMASRFLWNEKFQTLYDKNVGLVVYGCLPWDSIEETHDNIDWIEQDLWVRRNAMKLLKSGEPRIKGKGQGKGQEKGQEKGQKRIFIRDVLYIPEIERLICSFL